MSHRLLQHPDGTYAFVSTQKEWHSLGKHRTTPMTSDEALEETGAKYMELIDVPVFGSLDTETMRRQYRFAKYKGVMRVDSRFGTTTPVGVVGAGRTTTQYEELVAPTEAIRGLGGTIETFGLLGNGGEWFTTIKLPEEITIGGDKHYPYLIGYDGLWSNYVVSPNMFRVVCGNTCLAAQMLIKANKYEGAYVMRHTSRAEVDVKKLESMINLTYQLADEMDTISRIMLDQEFVDQEFIALTDNLFGTPEPDPETGKINPTAKINYRRRTRQLLELFDGTGQTTETTLRNGRPTKWTAFQAISEWVDWKQPVKGRDDELARRLERSMDPNVQKIKTQAIALLK